MTTAKTISPALAVVAHPAALAAAAFTIPFITHQPQLLVGSVVNTLLFTVASSKLSTKYLIPVACLPSLGAISHGMLFGKLTPVLTYLIPFIWLGNLMLMLTARRLQSNPSMIPTAVILKTLIIAAGAFLLFQTRIIPQALLIPMSSVQAATALIGAFLSLALRKVLTR